MRKEFIQPEPRYPIYELAGVRSSTPLFLDLHSRNSAHFPRSGSWQAPTRPARSRHDRLATSFTQARPTRAAEPHTHLSPSGINSWPASTTIPAPKLHHSPKHGPSKLYTRARRSDPATLLGRPLPLEFKFLAITFLCSPNCSAPPAFAQAGLALVVLGQHTIQLSPPGSKDMGPWVLVSCAWTGP